MIKHRKVRGVVDLAKLEIGRGRSLLTAEVRVLLSEAAGMTRSLVKEIECHGRRLESAKDAELKGELRDIDEALERVRLSLQRLSFASRSNRDLLDEWHEWEALRQASGGEHEIAEVRQELLVSELAVRGVAAQFRSIPDQGRNPRAVLSATIGDQSMQEEIDIIPDDLQGQEVCEKADSDWLDAWGSVHRQAVEADYAYWNDLVAAMRKLPYYDGEQAVALYRGLKRAHAEQRLLDRESGTKRYRLAAFDDEP